MNEDNMSEGLAVFLALETGNIYVDPSYLI